MVLLLLFEIHVSFSNMYHILSPSKISYWDEMILENVFESFIRIWNLSPWFHFKSPLLYACCIFVEFHQYIHILIGVDNFNPFFFFTTLMILPYIYGILNKVNFVKSLTWCKKECFILQIPNNLDMNLPKCQNFATHISIHPLQASLYICLVQTIIYNFLLQPIACILKVI